MIWNAMTLPSATMVQAMMNIGRRFDATKPKTSIGGTPGRPLVPPVTLCH
jgi:hypothetical protein